MKLQSFQQMLSVYGTTKLESDDEHSRVEMLKTCPYSIILEGEATEFDSLNKWIEANIGPDSIRCLFYGKIGYDYGFAEYFFASDLNTKKVTKVVQLIYTIYPDSYPPNQTLKSNGYNEQIVYDPQDKDAIVFGPEKSDK